MSFNANPRNDATQLHGVTSDELNAVSGGAYKALWDQKTATGIVFHEGGGFESYKNGKLILAAGTNGSVMY